MLRAGRFLADDTETSTVPSVCQFQTPLFRGDSRCHPSFPVRHSPDRYPGPITRNVRIPLHRHSPFPDISPMLTCPESAVKEQFFRLNDELLY